MKTTDVALSPAALTVRLKRLSVLRVRKLFPLAAQIEGLGTERSLLQAQSQLCLNFTDQLVSCKCF